MPANIPFEELFFVLKKAEFDAVELNLDAARAGVYAHSPETTKA